MSGTKIHWADDVWNPVYGCRRLCPYCYARNSIFPKCEHAGTHSFDEPFLIEKNLARPFPGSGKFIFVNSMSDIEFWKPEWIEAIISRMKGSIKSHVFILLTKGSDEIYSKYDFPDNVICGITRTSGIISCENLYSNRTWLLNVEPIKGHTDIEGTINRFSWLILGDETGKRENPSIPDLTWYDKLVDRFKRDRLSVFIKPSLHGITPEGLRYMERPNMNGKNGQAELDLFSL